MGGGQAGRLTSSRALVSTLKPWPLSMFCRLSRFESMASRWSLSSFLAQSEWAGEAAVQDLPSVLPTGSAWGPGMRSGSLGSSGRPCQSGLPGPGVEPDEVLPLPLGDPSELGDELLGPRRPSLQGCEEAPRALAGGQRPMSCLHGQSWAGPSATPWLGRICGCGRGPSSGRALPPLWGQR